MSRIFDLLQQASAEASVGAARPETSPRPELIAWNLPVTRVDTAPPSLPDLDPPTCDQLNRVVRHLFLLSSGLQTVVIAGVEPGNGCSWITAHCARLLAAQVNSSICVVEANFRSPGLRQYLAIENHPQETSAELPAAALPQHVHPVAGVRNLWLLDADALTAPGGHALVSSDVLRSRINYLKSGFKHILIDAGPLSTHGDAIALAQVSDGITLVTAESDTRRERARHALDDLAKANVRVLGAILNKRTFPIPEKIYRKL
jgi:Mrp family chromosome partitioning ATPase